MVQSFKNGPPLGTKVKAAKIKLKKTKNLGH